MIDSLSQPQACKHKQIEVRSFSNGYTEKVTSRRCVQCGADFAWRSEPPKPSDWIRDRACKLMKEMYGSGVNEGNFDYHSNYDHYRLHALMDYLDSHAH